MTSTNPQEPTDEKIQQSSLTSTSIDELPLSIDELIKERAEERAGSRDKPATLRNQSKTVSEQAINIEAKREQTRAWLAGGLLGLLALSLLGIAAYIFSDILVTGKNDERQSDLHRELMTIVWTSQVTLVSGALGYYFGSERNRNNSDE
ncbi:MAG: hypothetical protein QNJ46_22385 [Leptolyngbyaceae cyanobacterium MO_188.B28]|nr:hypothetical protein [Leptolyngbyaceae cyanobacterium MO_188.B28]